MSETLGIDLGTNSIGLSKRNDKRSLNLQDQLDYFSSVIFKSGVGKGESGEISYSAERREHRSARRLYKVRKYRIWATLKVLIKWGYCPLSKENLDKWSKYDKTNGLKRQYPINALNFEQWVRLDFNGDGVPDYISPYQLRAELMQKQFDFNEEINRHKLGRAIYHIAQRRGFKSSKGETKKEQEQLEIDKNNDSEIDVLSELKKSELKKSAVLDTYMKEHNFLTVGSALADLENNGVRIRKEYQVVRADYKKEIETIFNFQKGLDIQSEFYKSIISEKKGEGTIFYKNVLRSQKGSVGKCTLEKTKSRCPISHPEYEKFRAWSFINNIKYKSYSSSSYDWQILTIEQKEKLFQDKFMKTRTNFQFEEIRNWMIKEIGCPLDYNAKTINYKDKTNISGCPVSGRLKKLLGDDWESFVLKSNKVRINKKTGKAHNIIYDVESLWHICFSFDDAEYVFQFAKDNLGFDEDRVKKLVSLWGAIPQGYGMLSIKAIKKINYFLKKGIIYSTSVFLAKLPEFFGPEKWEENENKVLNEIFELIEKNRKEKLELNIANKLIADYKSLGYNDELQFNERFADHNIDYKLDDSDLKDIERCVTEFIGEKSWSDWSRSDKDLILNDISLLYQRFFSDVKRNYYHLPQLDESLKKYLSDHFEFLHCPNNFRDNDKLCKCKACKKLNTLYSPSMIEFYKPSIEDENGLKLLSSPVIGALKNPMAMRVLYILRKQINSLLMKCIIHQDTRVVVETAKDLNDANMRWAIETYDKEREKENIEFENAIKRHFSTRIISKEDINKTRLLLEQHITLEDSKEQNANVEKDDIYKKDVTKYRLWLEQGCCCIYTGRFINITSLFDDNSVDFEHTVPRSLSFDNSLANLTICDASFNRTIKKNQIPSQLSNYKDIIERIKPWQDKVERLRNKVEFWKGRAKGAQDKSVKDFCIRQRHLWKMELVYWQDKVGRFTMTEVNSGFRHSQLNDTRIITKYTYHYLKSVFNNVEVEKGIYTADFRKMLGIQSIEEKKNRDKYSHHAIDATVLTLIPSAAKRDRMLELFYKIQEEKQNHDVSKLENDLEIERRECGLGNVSNISNFIENNILIDHISRDKTLIPAKRKVRKRGKEIFIKDKEGNLVNKWAKGESIRGKIHKESFYGAIQKADQNVDGKTEVEFVIRRELKYKKNEKESGFASWEELEKCAVNKKLIKKIRNKFEDEKITSFKEACELGLYTLDKKGNKVNRIRHIRCFCPNVKKPLKIKQQTYLSKKDYKQYYYAEVGDLYVMCKYLSEDNRYREFHIWSLFDISENRKMGLEAIPKEIISEKDEHEKLILSEMIKVGDMLLIYKNSVKELQVLNNQDLSNRLYVVRGFENDGNRIILRKGLNAQKEKILGKGKSIKDYNEMPEKIRCGINTINYIRRYENFELFNGKIMFM